MLFDQRIYGEAWKPVVSHTARVPFRCNREREREKGTMVMGEIDLFLSVFVLFFFLCFIFEFRKSVERGRGCKKRYIRVIETWNKI